MVDIIRAGQTRSGVRFLQRLSRTRTNRGMGSETPIALDPELTRQTGLGSRSGSEFGLHGFF